MLRPKTSHASTSSSVFASPLRIQNPTHSFSADFNVSNFNELESTDSPANRRARSASSRLAAAPASPHQPAEASRFPSASPLNAPHTPAPLSSFSRPQSSMSGRSASAKLRPQSGASHIDAEALLHSSIYHGVPISKRSIPNDPLSQITPMMLPQRGQSHDVLVRSGDSVVMFDEESVRFTSFVNSVEVAVAQLARPSQSSMKDRVVMACNVLEKLCVFQTPAQRLIKLIKGDIYRGIWQHYQPPLPHVPEVFESMRGYFEDFLTVAQSLQMLTQQTNDALEQAASARASCRQKDQRIAELESVVNSLKQENVSLKEKEGEFQEIFGRSLARMRSDQTKRVEVEKELRDMQLKEAAFIHLAENEREDNRQRVNAIQLTVKQMEESYVDGERKRRELQHVMDSMFSRSAYTALYRNNEKKKILLARAEAQLRVKLMAPDWAPLQLDNAGPLPAAKSDKMKKIVAAIAGGKRNAVSANPREEVPAGTKVFSGLGEGRDLPRYLRSSAPVQHQSLHLQETQSLIKQFWSQVASASVASSGASIHDFLNSFFGKRNSGASTDSVSLAYSLILAAQKYSEDDVFIELFWKIWSGTWSEEVFIHQYRILEDLERFLISKKSEGNGSMAIEYLGKLLGMYFPQKKAIEIDDLVNCALSLACTGQEVNISRLFHQTDSAESHFVRLLWRQGLNERDLLLQLLQDAVFKLEPMASLKVKCRHLRSAFLAIDPNRPLDILEENLQLGFGMPPGCSVLSEDVISYDDFVLLLSTGTIRLYSNVAAGSTKNETISEK